MEKQLKRIIAIEMHSDTKEKRFELFEVLEKYCLVISENCSSADIRTIEKRLIGYVSVWSNDWTIRGQRISKKPEFKHLQTTNLQSTVSLYGDEPEEWETLTKKYKKLGGYYAIDLPNANATDYHQQLIAQVIFEQLKTAVPHYKIKLERVFFKATKPTDLTNNPSYCAIRCNIADNLGNLFSTHNAALCVIKQLKTAMAQVVEPKKEKTE